MEFENNQNNIEQVNQTPESENNSKVEKIDMSIVEYERKKDEFYPLLCPLTIFFCRNHDVFLKKQKITFVFFKNLFTFSYFYVMI